MLDLNGDCISVLGVGLGFFFFIPLLHVLLFACSMGMNLLDTLHLHKTGSMSCTFFGKNAAASVMLILNTVFQFSSVLQHVHSPRQNFCLHSFILPSSFLDSCEIQSATCFSLSYPPPPPPRFWCLHFFFFKDKFIHIQRQFFFIT